MHSYEVWVDYRKVPVTINSAKGNGQTYHILVAEDDPALCQLVSAVLSKGPYRMTMCKDAESAFVALREKGPFDLVLSDFMMPGMSGIELVGRIRARDLTIPIVMMSGHVNYAMGGRAKDVGANAFLHKPFTVSQLRITVADLLRGKATRSS